MPKEFGAPWSTKLKVMTAAVLALCLFVAYKEPAGGALFLAALILFAAFFAIRGYRVADGYLSVLQLVRSVRFDLAGLSSAEVRIRATAGSVRTMGIGGLFSFAGYFYSSSLGSYRAYATNELNTVVLVLNGKTIVVTPDDPVAFVDAVEAASLQRKRDQAAHRA